MKRRSKLIVTAVVIAVGAIVFTLRERENSAPCPYAQRYFLSLPRITTKSGLLEILSPGSNERVLEIGPGTGHYSLPVAQYLDLNGSLHILDVQQQMLDHTVQRARNQGIESITATHGDAQQLPYPDDHFDAAYLVATLGEIPDQEQALEELLRVLRPGGRLVVGEALPDPDMVRFGTLRDRCESIGYAFEQRSGSRFGYFARLRKPTQ